MNYSNEGIDELNEVHLLVASNNTWQGIISNYWPLTKSPPLITEEFVPKVMKIIKINLEENMFKYRRGNTDIKRCISDQDDGKCVSIFNSTLIEDKNR